MTNILKIVTYVPENTADKVRKSMGEAGAGKIGNYTHCSFSTKGIGRFIPQDGAQPAIGQLGQLEEVAEERIEAVCEENKLDQVIEAIKDAHPYEEVPIDVYPLVLK